MTEKTNKKLGRRDLLKLMTAGAGALTVSAFLPKKWAKPVVDVGVSPAHAAASTETGTITGTVHSGVMTGMIPGNPIHKVGLLSLAKVGYTLIPGAIVTAVGGPSLVSLTFSYTTSSTGLYSITVPFGTYAVTCLPPTGYSNPIPLTATVTINVTTPTKVQNFQCVPPTPTQSGI